MSIFLLACVAQISCIDTLKVTFGATNFWAKGEGEKKQQETDALPIAC